MGFCGEFNIMREQDTEIIEDINEEELQGGSSSDDIKESVNEEQQEEIVKESEENNDIVETVEENEVYETECTENEETESTVDDSKESEETKEDIESLVTEYVVYSSESIVTDYSEQYQELIAQQKVANELLYRINNQNDFIIGVGVTLIICCIAYSILERFSRF